MVLIAYLPVRLQRVTYVVGFKIPTAADSSCAYLNATIANEPIIWPRDMHVSRSKLGHPCLEPLIDETHVFARKIWLHTYA